MSNRRSVFKRIGSFLTACCTAVSAAALALSPISVSAESGSCGTSANWDLTNGTLTISGSGAVTKTAWSSYSDSIKSVVIGNGITSMPSSSFYEYPALTSVTMSDTVTSIGNKFCQGCSVLTDIRLSESLDTIGSNAFSLCIGIKKITIPDSVTTISSMAFFGNNATSVTLGRNVKTIGSNAFNRSCFSDVIIPDSVTSIGTDAFGIVCREVTLKQGLISYDYDDPVTYVTLHGTAGGAADLFAQSSNCNFVANGSSVHTHSWSDWVTVKAVTCTTDGLIRRTCSGCGTTEEQTVAATGHSWSEWITAKAATCTKDGTMTRSCANCGEAEVQTIPATGHSWSDWIIDKAATCTEAGSRSRTCANCGEKETEVIPAGSHNWSEWKIDKAATCTEAGSRSRTCANCGEKETEVIPAGSHNWSEWKTDKEATCTENGTISRKCANCGEIETETVYASGHSWSDWSVSKPATCTEDGAESRKCSSCGETESRLLPASGHSWSEWKIDPAPTCTKDGARSRTCTNCGEKETETLSATGHSWSEWKTDKAATCTENGSSVRTCANCGETETQIIPATGHRWSEWKTVTPAALDQEGSEERTCAVCGEKESRTIPALTGYTVSASAGVGGSITPSGSIRQLAGTDVSLTISADEGYEIADVIVNGASVGAVSSYRFRNLNADHQIFVSFRQLKPQHGDSDHVWSDWRVDTEPGCISDGRQIRTCTVCGETEYQTIPATGHQFGSWTVDIAATCTENGRNVRICTVCGEKEYAETPAVGHSWSEWKVVSAATPYEEGLEQRTCANCGETESRTIAKLSLPQYTVEISCGKGGSCTPNGKVLVNEGGSVTLTVTPDSGYLISAVLVDGVPVGSVTSYTIDNIRVDRTVQIAFAEKPADSCSGVIATPKLAVYLTDEKKFDMNDFTIIAMVNEDGRQKQVDITADCFLSGTPMAVGSTADFADIGITYHGSNSAVQNYFSEHRVTVHLRFGIRGDGNSNEKVEATDALLALHAYGDTRIGLASPLNDMQKILLDVDEDGDIDVFDAMNILRYFGDRSIGLETSWETLNEKYGR